MASPGSNAEVDEREAQNNLEQITFRFCSECSNMLYPKEDEDSHKLQFTCRTCQYTEEATSTCVFRNLMNNTAGATACKHDEAVFFQSQQRSAETGMALFFVCCECGNIFQ